MFMDVGQPPQPNKDLLDISGWFCIRNSEKKTRCEASEVSRNLQFPLLRVQPLDSMVYNGYYKIL